MEEKGSAYSVLVEISGGKRPPGKPQHKWKDNIKIYLKETGWEVVGCIFLGTEQRQVVGCVGHLAVRLHKMWEIEWMRKS